MNNDDKLDTFADLCESMDIEYFLITDAANWFEMDLVGYFRDYEDLEWIVEESGLTLKSFRLVSEGSNSYKTGEATIVLAY